MVHRNWSGILRLRNTIGCGTVLRLCIHYTLHWTRIGGTGSLLWPSLGAVRPIIDDATCHARGFEEHKKPGRKGLRKAQTLEPVLQASGAYKDQGCVSFRDGPRYDTSFPCPESWSHIRSDRASGPHLPRAFPRDIVSKCYDSAQLE